MEHSAKFQIEISSENYVTVLLLFSGQRRIWPFHAVVLQSTAKECTKNYNARVQPLNCSLNILFGGDPVAVVNVVFFKLPNYGAAP